MKVVWICHFSNEEVQSRLPLYKKVDEFAPWIPNMIKEFERRQNNIELHIISPHNYLKKISHIKLRGVNYYFIPAGIPLLHFYYPNYIPLDVIFGYFLFNQRVKKIVNKIKPNIINLIGAENAYYSKSILGIKNYPVIVTIQGFISEFWNKKLSIRTNYRVKIEKEILKKFKHFIGEENSKDYIKKFNTDFKFFKAYFPTNEEIIFKINSNDPKYQKTYDLIYFGRIDKIKGAFDLVNVAAELKKYKKDVKAAITGPGDILEVKKYADEQGCSNNIDFIDFQENQEKLFRLVKSSKTVIIPSYFDRLPSTIRESMLLKIPVIAYKTGGIPLANRERENIILVEKGDYKKMASEIFELLNNDVKRTRLIENAFDFANKEFSLKNNIDRMVEAYQQTIEDFKI